MHADAGLPIAQDARREPPAKEERVDTALLGFAIVAAFQGVFLDPQELVDELGIHGRQATREDLQRACARKGLHMHRIAGDPRALVRQIRGPSLLQRKDGSYVVVGRALRRDVFRVIEPRLQWRKQPPVRLAERSLLEMCGEELYLLTRAESVERKEVPFGFRWFLPSLLRHRSAIVQILVASFFVQLFALGTPLFFQLIIDKVLVHNSASTLIVVTVALAAIGLFDVLLQYLRSYTLGHTASRIDVELGGRLFGHLLKLPLAYFENRPAGQTVARVRELETIRGFLTGQGLTALIDVVFTVVFVAVLMFYSPLLTFIVLGSIPLYILTATIFRPFLRDCIGEKFTRGAESQQFLVESIIGVHTLKAAAVEPVMERQWGEKLSAYVKTSFQAFMVAALGQNIIQYLTKLSTALLLFFGAHQVIQGNMTVGALVAFNMLSAQVLTPVLRLSQLWQDLQQAQISVDRLGDIFKASPEAQPVAHVSMPQMRGAVSLRNVHFRYSHEGPEVLKGVSLDIAPGQVVGIVGASGSGKSTLTKLIQRLYVPTAGEIAIDGLDIAKLRLPWLRGQMGVVLQENLLFNRTVRENIALANPLLSLERIVEISKLAGADEFISRLPLGYESAIVERGANLSGGQRQRIAIARALARDPRILILDEATSALDYESEQIIQQNMRDIVRGRTVIIVAHRLAAVRHCHRIIAISDGRVVEDGPHEELVNRRGGLYAHLWSLQSAGAAT